MHIHVDTVHGIHVLVRESIVSLFLLASILRCSVMHSVVFSEYLWSLNLSCATL